MKVTKSKNGTWIELSFEEQFAIWFYQHHIVPRIIENLSDEQIKRFKSLIKKRKI